MRIIVRKGLLNVCIQCSSNSALCNKQPQLQKLEKVGVKWDTKIINEIDISKLYNIMLSFKSQSSIYR